MFNTQILTHLGIYFPRTLTARLNLVLVPIYTPFLPKTPLFSGKLEHQGVFGKCLGLFWERKEIFSTIFLCPFCFLVCIYIESSILYLVCPCGSVQDSRLDLTSTGSPWCFCYGHDDRCMNPVKTQSQVLGPRWTLNTSESP